MRALATLAVTQALAATLTTLATGVVAPAAAQPAAPGAGPVYPDRPVTLLHAYSPGSGSSVILRSLAEFAGKSLGQRFVVEDRPGAGGALAPTHMLRSNNCTVLINMSFSRHHRTFRENCHGKWIGSTL